MRKNIKITIDNFQSIKHAEFVIDGFTCITGKTNIGKSAVIRSIKSSLLNSPVTNMVRNGEKSCTVEAHSEEWGYKWQKGKGTSRYYIDGKEDPLDSIGQGQVEEIANFGFGSIRIGDRKILYPWLATQFDPVFLLNQSGPAITDFISDVSRLDVLQRGITIANKERKRCRDKSKIIDEDIKRAKSKLEKFERYPEMQTVLNDLREQKASIDEYDKRIQKGETISAGIAKCSSSITLLSPIEKVKIPDLPDEAIINRLIAAEKTHLKLQECASAIISLRGIEKVKIPANIEISEIEKIDKIQTFQKKKSELEHSIQVLSHDVTIPELPEPPDRMEKGYRILREIKRVESEIKIFETKGKECEVKLEELDAEIAKIPRCSACQQPWDSRHVH